MDFIEVEESSEAIKGRIKQNLKFKTGRFIWRIRFTAPIDPATINSRNLYVTDSSNSLLKASIRYSTEAHEIEIEPLDPYARDASYMLHISKDVRSVGGQTLKQDLRLKFKL